MYVCSCYAVTDGAIKRHAQSGCKNFRTLCKDLKCATQCGICAKEAKRVFDEAKKEAGKKPPVEPTAAGDTKEPQGSK